MNLGFWGALQLMLLAFKVAGVGDLSWWVTLIPLWLWITKVTLVAALVSLATSKR